MCWVEAIAVFVIHNLYNWAEHIAKMFDWSKENERSHEKGRGSQ